MSFEPAVLHTVTAYHTHPGPANKPEVWARARLQCGFGTPFGGYSKVGAAHYLETNGKPKAAESTAAIAAINEHAQNAGNQN